MCSGRSDWALPQPGCPIRRSTDQSLVDSSPWLFAATHVLHRHLAPRHPPLALCSLKSHTPHCFLGRKKHKEPLRFQDARARYAVLKGHAEAMQDSRLRCVAAGELHASRCDACGSTRADRRPFCPREFAEIPLPQNRAVNTRRRRISVVPVTARPRGRGWRVHRGRDATVVTSNQ